MSEQALPVFSLCELFILRTPSFGSVDKPLFNASRLRAFVNTPIVSLIKRYFEITASVQR